MTLEHQAIVRVPSVVAATFPADVALLVAASQFGVSVRA